MTRKMQLILMAAGNSQRFGANKLLFPVRGKAMYRHLFDHLVRYATFEDPASQITVVSQYREILHAGERMKFDSIENPDPDAGISLTIRLALSAHRWQQIEPIRKRQSAAVFFTADQPNLTYESIVAFVRRAAETPAGLLSAAGETFSGNPVSFDAIYFDELKALTGDRGGKVVLNRYPEDREWFPMTAEELRDIDTQEQLKDG